MDRVFDGDEHPNDGDDKGDDSVEVIEGAVESRIDDDERSLVQVTMVTRIIFLPEVSRVTAGKPWVAKMRKCC